MVCVADAHSHGRTSEAMLMLKTITLQKHLTLNCNFRGISCTSLTTGQEYCF